MKNPILIKAKSARWVIYGISSIFLAIFFVSQSPFAAQSLNGFDLSNSTIEVTKIFHGGPAKDGIPAINQPQFITNKQVDFMNKDDLVLALQIGQQKRAYPLRVLVYHEIVNDRLQDKNILITYCPLCGSGMAFQLTTAENFGVSGLLYNSDMLLYDQRTDSLWSQLASQAISGPRAGEKLKQIPLRLMSWQEWLETFPNGQVLSEDTGFYRNYSRSPYPDYVQTKALYFPVSKLDKRYHPKEQIIAYKHNNDSRVYPFSELSKSPSEIIDSIGGQSIKVSFNHKTGSALITDMEDTPLNATYSYWFAWMVFNPDTRVYKFYSDDTIQR